ncbi:MAG: glycosyltransferase [Candidatus Portnoybacteria bacterium]|nr:glycosyltransferase [Candidatus Portnoybacteria bacterium]
MNKLVTIHILTFNSEQYIEDCLNSALNQTYENIEIIVTDNNSKDKTIERLKQFKDIRIIKNKRNTGYTGGHNKGIKQSRGEYIILLNPDVVLDKDFTKNIVRCMEEDKKIGAIQAKVYQLNKNKKTNTIDTLGNRVFNTGRIIDIQQGEKDKNQKPKKLFAANGVCPAYRQKALNDIKLKTHYLDQDFFCYVEDIDLSWRLRWRNWKIKYCPKATAWHDRTSAKSLGKGFKGFRKIRKTQSLWMRKIGWRNQRLLFIKNMPISNIFSPTFFLREIKMFLYLLFFEPRVAFEIRNVLKLMPKMIKKRRIIMKNKKVKPREIKKLLK